jgi:hypothetical protein
MCSNQKMCPSHCSKGKEELTEYVLAGHRPPLDPDWPDSLKELLQLCWHQDPDKRYYSFLLHHSFSPFARSLSLSHSRYICDQHIHTNIHLLM